MNGIWESGLELIRVLQRTQGPVADTVFRGLSLLGEEQFFLCALPLLLWCSPRRRGAELCLLVLVTFAVNDLLKCLLAHPRPFELDPAVGRLGEEGYGLPSGHAQAAVVLWGGLAAWTRRPAAWAAALALAFGIGLSRVYLGVHFPTDVLGGWLVGAALLASGLALGGRLGRVLSGLELPAQLGLALGLPILLAAAHPDKTTVAVAGTLAGFGLGLALGPPAGPQWPARPGLRLLIGLPVTAALYVGLKMVFPDEGEALYLPLRFLRYTLIGLWVAAAAPALFLRLGLQTLGRPGAVPVPVP